MNLTKLETFLSNLSHWDDLKINLFETIPSTNQKLWEILDRGITPPVTAIAAQQTAGRGQWGRQWQSEPGGLYLSLALSPNLAATEAPHLTISSAWGIADSLRRYQIPVWLKWPNDLTIGGKKLGGIKSETRIKGGKIPQAVIGVGLNWSNPVPKTGINLQSFSRISCLEELAAIALSGLFSGYQRYQAEGIDKLLTSYLELLEIRRRGITVNGCPGMIVGVTSQGELRVRLDAPGAKTEICLAPGTISLGYDNESD